MIFKMYLINFFEFLTYKGPNEQFVHASESSQNVCYTAKRLKFRKVLEVKVKKHSYLYPLSVKF